MEWKDKMSGEGARKVRLISTKSCSYMERMNRLKGTSERTAVSYFASPERFRLG